MTRSSSRRATDKGPYIRFLAPYDDRCFVPFKPYVNRLEHGEYGGEGFIGSDLQAMSRFNRPMRCVDFLGMDFADVEKHVAHALRNKQKVDLHAFRYGVNRWGGRTGGKTYDEKLWYATRGGTLPILPRWLDGVWHTPLHFWDTK